MVSICPICTWASLLSARLESQTNIWRVRYCSPCHACYYQSVPSWLQNLFYSLRTQVLSYSHAQLLHKLRSHAFWLFHPTALGLGQHYGLDTNVSENPQPPKNLSLSAVTNPFILFHLPDASSGFETAPTPPRRGRPKGSKTKKNNTKVRSSKAATFLVKTGRDKRKKRDCATMSGEVDDVAASVNIKRTRGEVDDFLSVAIDLSLKEETVSVSPHD